jgi:hypothetical protein
MENLNHEPSPRTGSPSEAYEQNHYGVLVELAGRITVGLAANYRNEYPRSWEYVGKQEELIAMLQGVADYMGA